MKLTTQNSSYSLIMKSFEYTAFCSVSVQITYLALGRTTLACTVRNFFHLRVNPEVRRPGRKDFFVYIRKNIDEIDNQYRYDLKVDAKNTLWIALASPGAEINDFLVLGL